MEASHLSHTTAEYLHMITVYLHLRACFTSLQTEQLQTHKITTNKQKGGKLHENMQKLKDGTNL